MPSVVLMIMIVPWLASQEFGGQDCPEGHSYT